MLQLFYLCYLLSLFVFHVHPKILLWKRRDKYYNIILSAISSIFSFISILIYHYYVLWKIMSLSPISLAFSGVIMFFISSVFNPNAETNTLSSANVALIYMRLLASSRLDILSKSIPLGDISIAEAVIIQSHVSKLRSINGNQIYCRILTIIIFR